MFEFKACEVLKAKELTYVNDCFEYERNDLLDIIDKLLAAVKVRPDILQLILLKNDISSYFPQELSQMYCDSLSFVNTKLFPLRSFDMI